MLDILPALSLMSISLYVLVKGADIFLAGAGEIGRRLSWHPFLVGLVIVGFGTSLPEIASSFAAISQNKLEFIVANAVGSNIANSLLILGVIIAVNKVTTIDRSRVSFDMIAMTLVTVMLVVLVLTNSLSFFTGSVLIFIFILYLYWRFLRIKKVFDQLSINENVLSHRQSYLYCLFGMLAVATGAHYTVSSASQVAEWFGVSIGLVSILVVAMGTSLPELVVSVKAVSKGNTDLAVGNLVGSNIFNILLVIGLPSLFVALVVDELVLSYGITFMILSTITFLLFVYKGEMNRWFGVSLLVLFMVFILKILGI